MVLQIAALLVETLTWSSMITLILLETKVYIRKFRWLVRCGVMYVLVGDIVVLNLLLSVKDYCSRLAFNFKPNTLSFHFYDKKFLIVYVARYLSFDFIFSDLLCFCTLAVSSAR